MKYVKCLYDGGGESFHERLTIGKLYRVITYDGVNIIIKNDLGEYISFVMDTGYRVWFKDATDEYRNNLINSILR